MIQIADKKLTEVTIANAAKDADCFVLLQDRIVKQIPLSALDLGGGEVMEIELRKNEGYVEWRTKGSSVWHKLFSLDEVKGEPGKNGSDGKDGTPGTPGKNGEDGVSPNITIGTVETVENGQPAKVTITGTQENVVLNFQIPKGLDGTGAGDVTSAQLQSAIKENVTDKNFLQSSVAEQTYIRKDSLDTSGLLTTEVAEKTYAKKAEISSEISTHNAGLESHNDIRLLITGLTNRLNALADSDDQSLDQLSEIVAYIKSNKELIDDITTSKVSVDSIVDNLTTNVNNQPLSAAQGVALKSLIDAIVVPTLLSQLKEDTTHRTVTDSEKSTWNNKSNFSGNYNDLTNKPTLMTEDRVIQLIDGRMPASAEGRYF